MAFADDPSGARRSTPLESDRRARANVLRLALAQAGANSAVIFATGSIVGAQLAPSAALATVPLSVFVVGMAAGTLPAGWIARHHGRRAAFIAGTGCGALTGVLAALVLETHRPEERTRVQALNDFLVFGTMAVGSFSSGQILAAHGWAAVNLVVFPPVALAAAVLAASGLLRRRAASRLA